MKINIRTQGTIKMSDAVKEHITQQVMELEKLFNESEHINVNVLCAEKNEKNVTEITIVSAFCTSSFSSLTANAKATPSRFLIKALTFFL